MNSQRLRLVKKTADRRSTRKADFPVRQELFERDAQVLPIRLRLPGPVTRVNVINSTPIANSPIRPEQSTFRRDGRAYGLQQLLADINSRRKADRKVFVMSTCPLPAVFRVFVNHSKFNPARAKCLPYSIKLRHVPIPDRTIGPNKNQHRRFRSLNGHRKRSLVQPTHRSAYRSDRKLRNQRSAND